MYNSKKTINLYKTNKSTPLSDFRVMKPIKKNVDDNISKIMLSGFYKVQLIKFIIKGKN